MRGRAVQVLLWLTCHLLASTALASQAPLELSEDGRVALTRGWALLMDPDERVQAGQLGSPELDARFVPFTGSPALGYFNGAAWLRLTLERTPSAPSDWLLELKHARLQDVQFFTPGPAGGHLRQTAGSTWSGSRGLDEGERSPTPSARFLNPTFQLTLPAGDAVTVYVRLKGRSSHSFSAVLWTPSHLAAALSLEQWLLGLFIGVQVILILINFWLFQATREPAYGWLAFFILAPLTFILGAQGYLLRHLPGGWGMVSDWATQVGWMYSVPLLVAFLFSYVRPQLRANPVWIRVLLVTVFAIATAGLLIDRTWAPAWIRPVYQVWELVLFATLIALLLGQARRGSRPARLSLWAFSPVLGALGLLYGNNAGLIARAEWAQAAFYLGCAIYLLVMTYAVTRQYEDLRLAREAADQKALEASRRAERELEARVAERTQALQEALAQLEQALRVERQVRTEQSEFFATVSHELRTPLAVIDATAQNLTLANTDTADRGTQLRYEKIQAAASRLAVILDRYLAVDRFTLRKSRPQKQTTDLLELLDDAAASCSLLSRGHEIRVESRDLPEPFRCDPDLTRLVLRSLADNAIKYSPPGTRVVLRAVGVADGVNLEVEDYGLGIDPDDLPHLFEPGFKGKNLRHTGTGVGLALARRVIESQGGTLRVTSVLGKGTVFRVWLPLESDPLQQGAEGVTVCVAGS